MTENNMTDKQAEKILNGIAKFRELDKEFSAWLEKCHALNTDNADLQFNCFENNIKKFVSEVATEFCVATHQVGKEKYLSHHDIDWIEKNTIKLQREFKLVNEDITR